MILNTYNLILFIAFLITNISFAQDVTVNVGQQEEQEEKGEKDEGADEEQEEVPENPVSLPQDVREQITINVLNGTNKGLVFLATKFKAAKDVPTSILQEWESITIDAVYTKNSATILTIHGAPGAKFEFDGPSELLLQSKNERGKDEFISIECVLATTMKDKAASKNITFDIRIEEGASVPRCIVEYDKDLGEPN